MKMLIEAVKSKKGKVARKIARRAEELILNGRQRGDTENHGLKECYFITKQRLRHFAAVQLPRNAKAARCHPDIFIKRPDFIDVEKTIINSIPVHITPDLKNLPTITRKLRDRQYSIKLDIPKHEIPTYHVYDQKVYEYSLGGGGIPANLQKLDRLYEVGASSFFTLMYSPKKHIYLFSMCQGLLRF